MRELRHFALAVAAILGAAACVRAANEKVTWKPLPDAIFRIDDQAPKQWNLFAASKKNDPLLLQYGTRSLVIYVQQKQIYEIAAAKLGHKGDDLLWRETDKPAQPLATSNWNIRDVGAALRISITLSAGGHVLDIQLPEPLDNHVFF